MARQVYSASVAAWGAAAAVALQTSLGLAGAALAPIAGGTLIDLAGYRAAFLLAVGGILLARRGPEPAGVPEVGRDKSPR